MTKLPFKINTDVSIRDLMDYAEFKLRLAENESNEQTQLLLRTQATELQFICDSIVKSAVENTSGGLHYLAAYEVPSMLSLDAQRLTTMVNLTKKALPNFTSAMSNKKFPFNIEEAKLIVEELPEGKEITKPETQGMDLEKVAQLVLTKKYGANEGDDEYVKMVKETVIAAMKQKVDTDRNSPNYGQPINGRMEAVRFLKDYAFKSLNWSDTEAHVFINRLKEVEEIEEPSRKEKIEESEKILSK